MAAAGISLPPDAEACWPGAGAPCPAPLVSVIVRTKDRPGFLRQALQSLAGQTYPRIEAVIVNDGGMNVAEIVRETVPDRLQTRYVEHARPQGRAGALNVGIDRAAGEWIAFLDDDDLFLPDHLQTLVTAAGRTGAGLIYGKTRVRPMEAEEREEGFVLGEPYSRAHLLLENYIALISILVRRPLFGLAGGFDPELEMFEDWDFLIRAGRHARFQFVDRVTSCYRRHDAGITVCHQAGSDLYRRQQQRVWEKNFSVIRENWPDIAAWCFDVRNRNLRLRQENDYFRKEALALHAEIAELRRRLERTGEKGGVEPGGPFAGPAIRLKRKLLGLVRRKKGG